MNYYAGWKKEIVPDIIVVDRYVQQIDISMLLSLFDYQTPTGNDKAQNAFIEWVKEEYIEKKSIECEFEYDEYGNFYITKGKVKKNETYPCIIAHVDTVHDFDINMTSYRCGDFIIGMSKGEQCGIGADDKNGIYILLKYLERFDKIKCVLFKNEESGKL